MSVGRPNCLYSAMNLPSWSKAWMRLLPRSATRTRPPRSMMIAWSPSNSPGPFPYLPQALMNFPSFENLTTRSLLSGPPWPSATKMSPLGASTTSVGELNASGPLPVEPGLPSVRTTLPSALYLTTVWPLPTTRGSSFFTPGPDTASVTQMLPSLPTYNPCGQTIVPAPQLLRYLPDLSILMMGSWFDEAHSRPPHRVRTIRLPSEVSSVPITS